MGHFDPCNIVLCLVGFATGVSCILMSCGTLFRVARHGILHA